MPTVQPGPRNVVQFPICRCGHTRIRHHAKTVVGRAVTEAEINGQVAIDLSQGGKVVSVCEDCPCGEFVQRPFEL